MNTKETREHTHAHMDSNTFEFTHACTHSHTHTHTHTCRPQYLVDVDGFLEVVDLIRVHQVGKLVLAKATLEGTHTLVHLVQEALTHIHVTLADLREADCGVRTSFINPKTTAIVYLIKHISVFTDSHSLFKSDSFVPLI